MPNDDRLRVYNSCTDVFCQKLGELEGSIRTNLSQIFRISNFSTTILFKSDFVIPHIIPIIRTLIRRSVPKTIQILATLLELRELHGRPACFSLPSFSCPYFPVWRLCATFLQHRKPLSSKICLVLHMTHLHLTFCIILKKKRHF